MYCPCNPFDSDSEEEELDEYNIRLVKSETVIQEGLNRCPSPTSMSQFTLDESYDPEVDFVRHYNRKEVQSVKSLNKPVLPLESIDNIRRDALELFADKKSLTPRELSRGLDKYEVILLHEQNFERKAQFIKEYQEYKEELDGSNMDDFEQATSFLKAARSRQYTLQQRLEFYQKALIYTNKKENREPIQEEYNQFCLTLK